MRPLERYRPIHATNWDRLFTHKPPSCADSSPDGRPCATRPSSLRTFQEPCFGPYFFFRIDRGRNLSQGWRIFNGPDGYQYRWGPSPSNNGDIVVRKTFPRSFFSITQILPRSPPFRPLKQLQDPNGHIIARMQEVAPTKYNVGDVYRELHYIRSAGAGVVVSSVGPCCYLLAWARLPRDIQPLGALLPREG